MASSSSSWSDKEEEWDVNEWFRDGVVLIAPFSESWSRFDDHIFAAARQLRQRINISLCKIFGYAGRSRYPVGQGGYRVAYEPRWTVFEAFNEHVETGCARYSWLEGHVFYFGDTSHVHGHIRGKLQQTMTNSIIAGLRIAPALPFYLEKAVKSETPEGDHMRGYALFEILFCQLLSSTVGGFHAKLTAAKTPVTQTLSSGPRMTKDADVLFGFDMGCSSGYMDHAIAVEVAFGNESLSQTKWSSELWAQRAILSLGIKIDAAILARPSFGPFKPKTMPCYRGTGLDTVAEACAQSAYGFKVNSPDTAALHGEDEHGEFLSIDPRIAVFVVREPNLNEVSSHPSGKIQEQYSIGRGSGIKLLARQRQRLLRSCGRDARLLSLYHQIDFEGDHPEDPSNYFQPFPGFDKKPPGSDIILPLYRVLKAGIDGFHRCLDDCAEGDLCQLSVDDRHAFLRFVRGSSIGIVASQLRYFVIEACLRQHAASLPPLPQPDQDDESIRSTDSWFRSNKGRSKEDLWPPEELKPSEGSGPPDGPEPENNSEIEITESALLS